MSILKLTFLLVFSLVLGTVLFWCALFFWYEQPVSILIESARASFIQKPHISMNVNDAAALGRLVSKGLVLEENDLLSQISGFYTTIITILITILTLLGISIPLYIKTNAEVIASRQTKNEVIKYCKENTGFAESIENAISREKPSIVSSLRQTLDNNEDFAADFSRLEGQVSEIQLFIEKMKGLNFSESEGVNNIANTLDLPDGTGSVENENSKEIEMIKKDIEFILEYVQELDPKVNSVDDKQTKSIEDL